MMLRRGCADLLIKYFRHQETVRYQKSVRMSSVHRSESFHENLGVWDVSLSALSASSSQSFEDTNETYIIFNVKVKTLFGDRVFVAGNCAELGDWDVHRATKLKTEPRCYPNWSAAVHVRQGIPIEYKFIIKDFQGQVLSWEPTSSNRRIHPSGVWMLIDDGVFGVLQDSNSNSHVLNNARFERLANEMITEKQHRLQQESDYKKLQHELHLAHERLITAEHIMDELKQRVSFLEGCDMPGLTLSKLKDLAQHSRKVFELATATTLKRLEAQLDESLSSKECIACMDGHIDVLCLPCGHLVLCNKCADKISAAGSRCPICKLKISSFQKVFGK